MHDKKLMSLDPAWTIEREAMQLVCSVNGATMIKAAWTAKTMPSESQHRDAVESARLARGFLESGLCKWSHASAQSELEVATVMIESLRDGHPPQSAKAKTSFLQETFAELAWFVRHEVDVNDQGDQEAPSGSASRNPEPRKRMEYGAKALVAKWDELLRKKQPEQMTMADLEIFGCFRHLLHSEQQKLLDECVKGVYARSPAVAKAKPAARRAKAKASPSSQQATSVAMSLLGL